MKKKLEINEQVAKRLCADALRRERMSTYKA